MAKVVQIIELTDDEKNILKMAKNILGDIYDELSINTDIRGYEGIKEIEELYDILTELLP